MVSDCLTINFSAMADFFDSHDQHNVVHRINDPIITDTNTVGIVTADQLLTARWAGRFGKTFHSFDNTIPNR